VKRKITVFTLSALLFALCSAIQAQQPKKVPRIGFLSAGAGPRNKDITVTATDPRLEGFRQGLRELRYVEGQNITLEIRWGDGKTDRLSQLAAELVRLKMDIIVTDGDRATRAAKQATATIPIVMGSDSDPVGSGLVASLARPGSNITGLTNLLSGLSGKRLEVLKEAIAGMSRVGVIWNPESPPSAAGFKEAQIAAKALGLPLQSLEMRGPDDFEGAFQAAAKGRAGALTVLSDALMFSHRIRILELAAKYKLSTMHTQSLWVEAGGLMSYGTYFPDLFRRAATYADKILKGAKPADLPVEQPTKFEFIINLKAAKQIGLTIPPNLLARADKVFK
jgi:ABC-type uncharacterized transport system substrate-binding protein